MRLFRIYGGRSATMTERQRQCQGKTGTTYREDETSISITATGRLTHDTFLPFRKKAYRAFKKPGKTLDIDIRGVSTIDSAAADLIALAILIHQKNGYKIAIRITKDSQPAKLLLEEIFNGINCSRLFYINPSLAPQICSIS